MGGWDAEGGRDGRACKADRTRTERRSKSFLRQPIDAPSHHDFSELFVQRDLELTRALPCHSHPTRDLLQAPWIAVRRTDPELEKEALETSLGKARREVRHDFAHKSVASTGVELLIHGLLSRWDEVHHRSAMLADRHVEAIGPHRADDLEVAREHRRRHLARTNARS